MTFYVENETETEFAFNTQEIVQKVAEAVLDSENCPYEAVVNVLLTDNEGIREYNREHRGINKPTDVLSFPNLEYIKPAVFDYAEQAEAGCFDPDSGELIMGDIIISVDKIKEQAVSYGHSEVRELAFLLAHSMLHLCGYDHLQEEEAEVMEAKQKDVLDTLNITRD